MNAQEKELIKTIASSVMGWIVTENYIEHTDTADTYLFFDEDKRLGLRPITGTVYPHNETLLQHGASAYGITWKVWNPLADPIAYTEVINKLVHEGWHIDLCIGPGTITSTVYSLEEIASITYDAPTIGEAICGAAFMLANQITSGNAPSINDWSERPQHQDKIEVHPGITSEWEPCIYMEGGAHCYLKFSDGFMYRLDEEAQLKLPKWRYPLTA